MCRSWSNPKSNQSGRKCPWYLVLQEQGRNTVHYIQTCFKSHDRRNQEDNQKVLSVWQNKQQRSPGLSKWGGCPPLVEWSRHWPRKPSPKTRNHWDQNRRMQLPTHRGGHLVSSRWICCHREWDGRSCDGHTQWRVGNRNLHDESLN